MVGLAVGTEEDEWLQRLNLITHDEGRGEVVEKELVRIKRAAEKIHEWC